MSGQYPPPNPFSRAPLHQRPQTPWGHSSHPHPQSTGMVGSPLNMYGSPHMGLGSHGGGGVQPWTSKPADANPLMRLQQLGGGLIVPEDMEPQEETMDLSSHSNVAEDGLKGSNDVLRNGAVLPVEVNGDVNRTETNSIVTSVIATNPLREGSTDALNRFKAEDKSLDRTVERSITDTPEGLVKSFDSVLNTQSVTNSLDSVVDTQCVKNNLDSEASTQSEIKGLDSAVSTQCATNVSSGLDLNFSEPVNKIVSSVFKTSGNTNDVSKNVLKTDRISDLPVNEDDLESSMTDNVTGSNVMNTSELPQDRSHISYLESSSLSIDTDDSKLVVAESSTDDIFGLSPSIEPAVTSAQDDKKPSESSAQPNCNLVPEKLTEFIPAVSESNSSGTEASSVVTASTAPSLEAPTVETSSVQTPVSLPPAAAPVANNPDPHPSVENVEILLESMFNSQEEDSSTLLNSNNSMPQSVIVSSGLKDPLNILRPKVDTSMPMKEEELAKTLAEDNPIEDEILSVSKEKKVDVQANEPEETIDEIEKELEMLIDCKSNDAVKLELEDKIEVPVPETAKEDPSSKDVAESNIEDVLMSTDGETTEEQGETTEEQMPVVKSESLETKPDPSSSSNPFIEVETQLEQMFAGIVEATDETGSDPQSQPSVSEPKKTVANRRSVTKRKKTNSRRSSDNSLFGGSSGESSPVKKKGRKRLNESGSERKTKKMKSDSDNMKKGKILREGTNDKVKGPFLHIEGSKENPASVVVINSGVRADDDDGTDKTSARRKQAILKQSEVSRRGLAYSSSTLSNRYNADTVDLTWVCVFCKRGPHCAGGLGGEAAGDLFGPYRIPATPPASVDDTLPPGTPSDREIVEEQKKRGGKYAKSLRASGGTDHFIQKISKKKRSMSTDGLEPQSGLLAVDGGYEVWLHGPCAEWAPGLCIIGTQLVGLDDAVWSALNTRCAQCGESGAGIGCTTHRCPARMHYHCASLAGWLLDVDTFISQCNVHRTRPRPS